MVEQCRGLEALAVDAHGRHGVVRAEMMRKGVGQSPQAGGLCTEVTRAEHPQRGHVAEGGGRMNAAIQMIAWERALEVPDELVHLIGEVLGGERATAAQR